MALNARTVEALAQKIENCVGEIRGRLPYIEPELRRMDHDNARRVDLRYQLEQGCDQMREVIAEVEEALRREGEELEDEE